MDKWIGVGWCWCSGFVLYGVQITPANHGYCTYLCGDFPKRPSNGRALAPPCTQMATPPAFWRQSSCCKTRAARGALFSTAFLIYYILVQQVHGNRLSLASIIRAWRPTPTPPGLKHYQTQSNTPRLIPSFNLSQLFPRTLSQCSNSVFALSFGERHPAGGEVKRQAQGWGKVPKTGPCANPSSIPEHTTPHHHPFFFIVYSIPSATARCLPHVQPTFLSRRCRSRCSGECCPDCW